MINIYYCNWDSTDYRVRDELIPALLGCDFKFKQRNYRLVEECKLKYKEPNSNEIEILIADLDSDKEDSVLNFFIEILNTIWEDYNINHQHKFRSMCVGDVIEFSSDEYCIRFIVDCSGFRLMK